MFDITCYPWVLGRTNLDGFGDLGIPRYRPATEGKIAVETVVTSTFYTATLQPFTDLPHNLGAGIPLSAAPHPLKNHGLETQIFAGFINFHIGNLQLVETCFHVYDEFLASISFNFHMIRVDVYSICRFNMIEHDLTAHSKTSRPTQGPFPGHVAPMDACVLGQCRSATGGDLDWAIDQ